MQPVNEEARRDVGGMFPFRDIPGPKETSKIQFRVFPTHKPSSIAPIL